MMKVNEKEARREAGSQIGSEEREASAYGLDPS